MRRLTISFAAALALGVLGFVTPAAADHSDNYGNRYGGGNSRSQPYQEYKDYDYDRQGNRFNRWERGWRGHGDHRYGHGRLLPRWLLIRRIERQGYFAVRRLQPSRFGFGWRAFARYRSDGHRVMLRIDPRTGRVLAARHL